MSIMAKVIVTIGYGCHKYYVANVATATTRHSIAAVYGIYGLSWLAFIATATPLLAAFCHSRRTVMLVMATLRLLSTQ